LCDWSSDVCSSDLNRLWENSQLISTEALFGEDITNVIAVIHSDFSQTQKVSTKRKCRLLI